MTKDFKDIWDHFLKVSGDSKEDKKENCSITKNDYSQEDKDKDFFAENFEKYLNPEEFKKDSLKPNLENKKKSKSFKNPKSTLDLHGKTINESLKLLKFFINRSRAQNILLVLIIVGKGLHSEEGKSVIKETVINWLETKGKEFVSSYRFAPSKLGGDGAILLKIKPK